MKNENTFTHESVPIVVEALKVEGYWNDRSGSIYNKDEELIKYLKYLFKQIGIKTTNSYTCKINLKDYGLLKTKIIHLKVDDSTKNFHLQNGFIHPKQFISFYTKHKPKKVEIVTKNKKMLAKDFAIYEEIKFTKKEFIDYIEKNLKEKKKYNEITLPSNINQLNKKIIMRIFGIVVDCEGSVNYRGFLRTIRIRMKNKIYLEEWQNLLKKRYNVYARVSKEDKGLTGLHITGYEDFKRLKEGGFELHHSKKKSRFEDIMNNYKRKQISRGTSTEFYIKSLRKFGPITARDLAIKLNKSKRVVNHFLTLLGKSKNIKIDKSKVTYIYSA